MKGGLGLGPQPEKLGICLRNIESTRFGLGSGFQAGILDGAEHLCGCSAPAVPLSLARGGTTFKPLS
jgi:hypothetical protein